ncbi:two-component system response regulator YkoG [Bacillus sp. FSL H8-0515]|uniref:two-component system response regulator YkoG n=1 Tax=Bacillus sp. FSL H8-0515 TaxID=2921396 RepID=UPI00227E99DC|nr:two-component system response regulator YkoG [Bacillus sp. S20C3]MCY8202448.1 two-component system response regulator YkoG [Bacillus sp. N12A5]MCY8288167.1 two-component system response regulator YkoG [Bacillus sp. N13C7]MCY8636959.1 two-component system response regulator YkoG [Bacillus sp. S17B2]MCY8720032.1 two-component system response regulator YkoG [Bacillus sp. S10C12M]MCY9143248.1 two-component system response regulator YkoG [Bacillus sp. T9C1]
MEKGNILIVEDEEKIARVLQLELEYEGYSVTIKHNGTEGLNAAAEGGYSLVLLDVMLPGLSGLEVLRRLRKTDQQTPVILLTARDSIPDKVTGLDIGANDYVTKPFEIEELLARIRAALRQNGTKTEDIGTYLTYDDLRVNEKTREVRRGDKEVELTPREFDLLVYMLKHPQQVLTREQILNSVWGFDYIGDTNVVDVYIRYIRKKLDYPYEKQLIHTVRGVGYAIKG